jgi:hypothetical protein
VPCSPDPEIACSLDAGTARSQLDEWATLLGPVVVSSERRDPTTLRILLDDASELGRIAELSRREVACCPFFHFAIEIESTGAALTVSVPLDAVPILDAFAALVTS